MIMMMSIDESIMLVGCGWNDENQVQIATNMGTKAPFVTGITP
mgnify:CR=1 FL=1